MQSPEIPLTSDGAQEPRGVLDGAREGPHAVQGGPVRDQPVARHAPVRGLDAHAPAEVRRLPDAAACASQAPTLSANVPALPGLTDCEEQNNMPSLCDNQHALYNPSAQFITGALSTCHACDVNDKAS